MSSSTSTIPGTNQLVAFFRDREDGFNAIDELRNHGFSSNDIGLVFQEGGDTGYSGTDSGKSTWQKIKDFFTGKDEREDDIAYTSSDVDDSYRQFDFSDEQWKYYLSGISKGGAIVTVRAPAPRLLTAGGILKDNGADFRTSGFGKFDAERLEPDQRLQLRGELLRTFKERIAKGEVRLRKEVVSENRTVDVPVTREEVVIERVSADEARPISGKVANIGEGEEIRVPVSEERVRVEKEPVVTGEVRVEKRTVHDTQKVSDTVRREELKVEKEGHVNVDEAASTKRKKPAA